MQRGEYGIPVIPGVTQLTRIGTGGCATVYRGHQERNDRWVAVKVLNAAATDTTVRSLFLAECGAIGALSGVPTAVQIFQTDVLADGRPYLLMEWCDTSLADLVARRDRLPAARVAAIGYDVAQALAGVHARGRLHRDVKPANILLRPSRQAVLADFGLSLRTTGDGQVMVGGTPGFAAPEQLARDEASVRSDLFGLGASLYFALTGRAPYPAPVGRSDVAHHAGSPPQMPPGLPPALAAVVTRLLAPDPAARPADAADVVLALAAVVGTPGSAHPAPPQPDVAPPPQPDVAPPPQPDVAPPPERGGPPTGHPTPAPTIARLTGEGDGAPTAVPGARPGPAAGRTRRPAVLRWSLAGAAVFALLGTAAAVLAGDGDPPAPRAAPPTAASGPVAAPGVVLHEPVDGGRTVRLSWAGPPGYRYAVSIAASDGSPRQELVGAGTTVDVPVEPAGQYCFRVMATDGRQAVLSGAKGIRGAVCRYR